MKDKEKFKNFLIEVLSTNTLITEKTEEVIDIFIFICEMKVEDYIGLGEIEQSFSGLNTIDNSTLRNGFVATVVNLEKFYKKILKTVFPNKDRKMKASIEADFNSYSLRDLFNDVGGMDSSFSKSVRGYRNLEAHEMKNYTPLQIHEKYKDAISAYLLPIYNNLNQYRSFYLKTLFKTHIASLSNIIESFKRQHPLGPSKQLKIIDNQLSLEENSAKESKKLIVDEVLKSETLVVLRGEPGIGKTTTLIKRAESLLKELKNGENFKMPVYLKLTDIDNPYPNFLNILAEEFEISTSQCSAHLKNGIFEIYFDGFDEVKNFRDNAAQHTILSSIEKFSKEYFKNRFVVTTRKNDAAHFNNFIYYKVERFTSNQIISYLKQNTASKAISRDIEEKLKTNLVFHNMLSVPYYLSIYVQEYEQLKNPRNIQQLAGRFLELKLIREQSKDPTYNKKKIRNYLLRLGYYWKEKYNLDFDATINETTLCTLIDEISREKNYTDEDYLVIEKLEGLEIIVPSADQSRYSFADSNYGRYLFAEYEYETLNPSS